MYCGSTALAAWPATASGPPPTPWLPPTPARCGQSRRSARGCSPSTAQPQRSARRPPAAGPPTCEAGRPPSSAPQPFPSDQSPARSPETPWSPRRKRRPALVNEPPRSVTRPSFKKVLRPGRLHDHCPPHGKGHRLHDQRRQPRGPEQRAVHNVDRHHRHHVQQRRAQLHRRRGLGSAAGDLGKAVCERLSASLNRVAPQPPGAGGHTA